MQKKKSDLKERTRAFALRIIKMSASLPESAEASFLGQQVLRAGTSVGLRYRESSGGRAKSEFVAGMGACLKGLDETTYWCELLSESSILPANRLSGLLQEAGELAAIFATIIKKTKANSEKN